jgi:cellulose synthase/poly-beta-1,6-N-acetylglucosamine synthase-like glycosyltransferase
LVWYHSLVLYAYLGTVAVLGFYGLHRYLLVYLYYKHEDGVPRLKSCFSTLPRVTVQLPMFNERLVAERVIERACLIDYPRDRLQIQVLDDSTDDTTAIARTAVDRLKALGHDVVLLHRADRTGFKAGALQAGMASATGELVCIFDADFVPTIGVLHDIVHHFTDPKVGMVQVRWGHLNREQSLLTRAQAVLLDGHFVMEHGARNRSGRFMSFNGTAGVWRRTCIDDAGGWEHDTLTEDLDLSYRAQLRGWQFLYLPDTAVPAELPPRMDAFKAQQFRWTKGGAQTCRKLLGRVLTSPVTWRVKIEAFFHLTSNVVYAFVVLMTLLVCPAVAVAVDYGALGEHPWIRAAVGLSLLLIATCSAGTFYVASQRELGKSWWQSFKYLPALIGLGVGIAVNNARATLEGFAGKPSPFVRTPKFGAAGNRGGQSTAYASRRRWSLQLAVEVLMGMYMCVCAGWVMSMEGASISLPFLVIFGIGYLQVAWGTWRSATSR